MKISDLHELFLSAIIKTIILMIADKKTYSFLVNTFLLIKLQNDAYSYSKLLILMIDLKINLSTYPLDPCYRIAIFKEIYRGNQKIFKLN